MTQMQAGMQQPQRFPAQPGQQMPQQQGQPPQSAQMMPQSTQPSNKPPEVNAMNAPNGPRPGMAPQVPGEVNHQSMQAMMALQQKQNKLTPSNKPQGIDPITALQERENRYFNQSTFLILLLSNCVFSGSLLVSLHVLLSFRSCLLCFLRTCNAKP
jgi:SWI/SNF-related matrix-associated actin-dependent regulator of chromatin subfamily A protein 2/4